MVVTGVSNGNGFPNLKTFIIQILTGPWFVVFGSLYIMSVSGALFSGDIKEALGYDQTTLNLLSFCKDLGTNVGIVAGVIAEIAPMWFVLSIGSVLNFSGFFVIWLAVTKQIRRPKVWQMCLYMCIGSNAITFSHNGAIVTCVKTFPQSRGVVLGILKGYAGLSGAMMTQLYHAIYGDNSKQLILLIGWLPAAISVVFVRTIRLVKVTHQSDEFKVFYKFLYISFGLAAFLMVIIIVEKKFVFNQGEYGGAAAVVLIFMFLPVAIVIGEELKSFKTKQTVLVDVSPIEVIAPSVNGMSTSSVEKKVPKNNDEANVSCWKTAFNPPNRGEDYTILQALLSIDMLMLFLTTICGVGGTLTVIDNLGQIGGSQGYPKKSISTFISLVSIWNYLGRVTSGFLSEIFLTKYKFPRPLMLTLVMLLSCVGHLLIAFNVPGGLYVASVVNGFCFGAQWPLIFAIISEFFGLKYYNTLLPFGSAASPVGSYVLNVMVAGHLYDVEGRKQMAALGITRKVGQDLKCSGTECFKLSFFIITAVTLLGVCFSIVLVIRTRKFYKGDIYKKFRVVDEAETEMAEAGNGGVVPAEASKGR